MPLDISDAESSFLKGRAEFEMWKRKFDAAWNMPTAIAMLGAYLNKMPIEAKMMAPVEAAIAQRTFDELSGGL